MKGKAQFNISIAEILDMPESEGHPYITKAKFILADDKPNGNGQAIKVEEFPGIIATAIGMPVKMNFDGIGVRDHGGSIPIGHIQDIQHVQTADGTNQLVAIAMLWNDEYPEEVEFLKTAHAEGKAPGISYEMGYKDSETLDGVQWLKKVITLAATFVEHPAYGSRTQLLALASLDDEKRNEGIVALADKIKLEKEPVIITEKGGNLMDEKELEELRAEAASKQGEIDALTAQLAEANANAAALQGELDSIKAAAIIDNRVRQYAEAGFALEADAEKLDKKKTFFASLDDDQWTEYLAELVSIKAAAPKVEPLASPAELKLAQAALNNAVPRLELDESASNLKDAIRAIARPYSV